MKPGRSRSRTRGFTLIELMIAVAVVGILAAVAYPSYLSRLQKSRRSDATAALVAAAQGMERYFSEHATYVGATLGSGGVYAASSTNGYYALNIDAQSATAFTLSASPNSAQSGDACGNFTYDQTGTKGVTGSLSAASCW